MKYEKKHAWSALLRLYHWTLVLSVSVLTFTGLYIRYPFVSSLTGGGQFPMANIRYIHFITSYIFTGAIIVRVYLAIFGNRHESLRRIVPDMPKTLKDAWRAGRSYFTMDIYNHKGVGHNGLAVITYTVTIIIAILEIISGFYLLYPESAFWQGWGLMIFGPQQQARFIHHLIMWYFIIFTMGHVYIVIGNEILHPDGMLSSMVGGWKFKPEKE